MAEFLILTRDAPVPDSAGKWYAARIVVVQEDDYQWGGAEGPPDFGIIKVPGVSKESAEHYMEEWRHNTSIAIVGSDPAADSYRLKLTSDRVSVSGKNGLIRENVEAFFTNWNAEIVNFKTDSVTFDLSVFGAITSSAFWGANVSSVVFVESDYNQSTGDHVVQIQSSPFSNQQMKLAVEEKGGLVIPPDSFVMNRSVAREYLSNDIEGRIQSISYAQRRWYITATGMTALNNAGGVITVTPQQFINNIADALDD